MKYLQIIFPLLEIADAIYNCPVLSPWTWVIALGGDAVFSEGGSRKRNSLVHLKLWGSISQFCFFTVVLEAVQQNNAGVQLGHQEFKNLWSFWIPLAIAATSLWHPPRLLCWTLVIWAWAGARSSGTCDSYVCYVPQPLLSQQWSSGIVTRFTCLPKASGTARVLLELALPSVLEGAGSKLAQEHGLWKSVLLSVGFISSVKAISFNTRWARNLLRMRSKNCTGSFWVGTVTWNPSKKILIFILSQH